MNITEEDIHMLHAVAGHMRRNESPRCSNDLMNLAHKLEALRTIEPVGAAPAGALVENDAEYWRKLAAKASARVLVLKKQIESAAAPAEPKPIYQIYQVRAMNGVWSDVDREIYEQYKGASYERRIVYLAAHLPTPTKGNDDTAKLSRCAASRDGECSHSQCPQLRDDEPKKSGRHCPLDTDEGAQS